MASLDRIANVNISLATGAIGRGTFSIALFAAPLASFADLVRVYNSADGATEDNLPPDLLKMITQHFSQTPRPKQVKVGRLSIAKAAIKASELIANAVYSLKIDGTLVSFTADASPTNAEVATGVAGAITTAAIAGVTAAAVGDVVEITYSGAVKPLTNFVKLQWDVITPSASATAVADDLTAINNNDPAWYMLGMVERDVTRVEAAAQWIEARDKMFGLSSAQADILNSALSTDLFSTLKTANYSRTFGLYDLYAATQWADAAWMGALLTFQPGSETWAHKRLNGVSSSLLTETNYNTIKNKNGNTFEPYRASNSTSSIALTMDGRTFTGEWIDVIRFRDWLKDYIQTSIVALLANRKKVPYTDQGIQLIASKLRESLKEGQRVGGIAPDEFDADGNLIPGFVIEVPLSSEIDSNTKATRELTLNFTARLAGAIHVVTINGTLAYEL